MFFNFSYYPKTYKNQALTNLKSHMTIMGEMIALTSGISLKVLDLSIISSAINWAKQDFRLIYIGIFDENNELISTFNMDNTSWKFPKEFKTKTTFEIGNNFFIVTPIVYDKETYGYVILGLSLKEFYENISKNERTTLYICFAMLLLGVFLSYIFSSKITHSLLKLQKATNEVSQGKYDIEIKIDSNDEIGQLADDFGVMLTKIKESIANVKAINQDLEHARDQAIIANNAKSNFLAGMSHELRTPMNSILGFAQLIKMDAKKRDDKAYLESVDRILTGGKHLLELINELLDLSQIESGKMKLTMEPVNILEIKNELMDIVNPLIEGKKIQVVNLEDNETELYVLADRMRLKQVLLNLLSNGIKYNKPNGTLTIAIRKKVDKVEVSIEDTGNGIPEEKQKYLFKPFERLGHEKSAVEGTGIGLTICKKIVELMQGSIGFESIVGKGSRFFIQINHYEKNKLKEQKIEETKSLDTKLLKKENEKLILYVEDNPANLDLVKRIFSNFKNIKLISAPTALKGLELAENNQPDMILMDINLPGMDGITAFKKLKEKDKTKNIPILAVTADTLQSSKKKALEMGFLEYIHKPLDIPLFLEKVNKYI